MGWRQERNGSRLKSGRRRRSARRYIDLTFPKDSNKFYLIYSSPNDDYRIVVWRKIYRRRQKRIGNWSNCWSVYGNRRRSNRRGPSRCIYSRDRRSVRRGASRWFRWINCCWHSRGDHRGILNLIIQLFLFRKFNFFVLLINSVDFDN